MKFEHVTTSMNTPLPDMTPRLPGVPQPVILPSGGIRRIYVDRDAAAEGRPPWIIEEMTGLCRRHRATDFAVVGFITSGVEMGARPSLWIETESEVRFFP